MGAEALERREAHAEEVRLARVAVGERWRCEGLVYTTSVMRLICILCCLCEMRERERETFGELEAASKAERSKSLKISGLLCH